MYFRDTEVVPFIAFIIEVVGERHQYCGDVPVGTVIDGIKGLG